MNDLRRRVIHRNLNRVSECARVADTAGIAGSNKCVLQAWNHTGTDLPITPMIFSVEAGAERRMVRIVALDVRGEVSTNQVLADRVYARAAGPARNRAYGDIISPEIPMVNVKEYEGRSL